MAEMIDIEVRLDPGVATVSITGEVDLYSSREARKAIMDLAAKQVATIVVDLSGVPYMDSSGLATLVEGLQKVEDYDGRFILCGLKPMVKKVFELSRLNTVFSIYKNLNATYQQLEVVTQ